MTSSKTTPNSDISPGDALLGKNLKMCKSRCSFSALSCARSPEQQPTEEFMVFISVLWYRTGGGGMPALPDPVCDLCYTGHRHLLINKLCSKLHFAGS